MSSVGRSPFGKEKKRKDRQRKKKNTNFPGGRRGRAGTGLRMFPEIQEETIRRDKPVSWWSEGARSTD